MVGGGLEDAMADLGDRTSDRKEFVVVANVPGTSSPSTALCSGVREVEKPSAPARALADEFRHRVDVVGVASSIAARA